MSAMSELVDFTNADGVATIRLQHGKVNALSVAVLNELAALAGAITSREIEARAVIVTGGPKIFAAGADIGEFVQQRFQESEFCEESQRQQE